MALILGGVGFYVGVRVEKSKIPSTSSGTSAFARAFEGASGTGSTASRTGGSGASSFASRFGAGGASSLFGGGSGNATIGSVSSIAGNTLYVTDTSGNTVKVKLSGQTKITKSESVAKSKVYPGDEVVIQGTKGSGGTVTATSVSDSGARSTGGTGSSSTGSSGSSSVISSLFGGS